MQSVLLLDATRVRTHLRVLAPSPRAFIGHRIGHQTAHPGGLRVVRTASGRAQAPSLNRLTCTVYADVQWSHARRAMCIGKG